MTIVSSYAHKVVLTLDSFNYQANIQDMILDAIREVQKYSHVDLSLESSVRHTADADAMIHMRLFRAQRNFYIAGFALLLLL